MAIDSRPARLTAQMAKFVVNTVKYDPECKKRIGQPASRWLSRLGLAGWMRNVGVMGPAVFTGKGPTPEQDKIICTGIADATAAAIDKAPGRVTHNIAFAVMCGRVLYGFDHAATRIQMVQYGACVFDWHATLDPGNPMIYRSVTDWEKGINGVLYSDFKEQ